MHGQPDVSEERLEASSLSFFICEDVEWISNYLVRLHEAYVASSVRSKQPPSRHITNDQRGLVIFIIFESFALKSL